DGEFIIATSSLSRQLNLTIGFCRAGGGCWSRGSDDSVRVFNGYGFRSGEASRRVLKDYFVIAGSQIIIAAIVGPVLSIVDGNGIVSGPSADIPNENTSIIGSGACDVRRSNIGGYGRGLLYGSCYGF